MEGKLVAASEPGCYLIGSREGPAIEQGQPIEIFLAGSWISGTVAAEGGESELAGEEDDDLITEASEESFPASDPPAWTTGSHSTLRQQESTSTHPTFYFVADSDGSVCGLCTGMLVRVSS